MEKESNKLIGLLIVIGAISLIIGSFTIGQYLAKENIFNIFGGVVNKIENNEKDDETINNSKSNEIVELDNKIEVYINGEKTELKANKISSKLGYELIFAKDKVTYSYIDDADKFKLSNQDMEIYLEVRCITDDTYQNITSNLLNPTDVLIGKNNYSAKYITTTTTTSSESIIDKLYYVKYQTKTFIIKAHYTSLTTNSSWPLFEDMLKSFVLVNK